MVKDHLNTYLQEANYLFKIMFDVWNMIAQIWYRQLVSKNTGLACI